MEKIRKGDEVIVVAGKNKGMRGVVLRRVGLEHVVVEGVNQAKKHVRPNPLKGIVGGIVAKEMPIHISNVAFYDAEKQKAARVGFKLLENGKKSRFSKSSGSLVNA
ncbi:MAG: 50S ribosomal protein L24 [Betaproteobacteria bacterium]|nr:50S ribosomal protein L24 [Betaproteobacteria bacterium]